MKTSCDVKHRNKEKTRHIYFFSFMIVIFFLDIKIFRPIRRDSCVPDITWTKVLLTFLDPWGMSLGMKVKSLL